MPLYEYRCLKCKRLSEKIERMDGPHLAKCPHCGGKVEPMISAPAIQFKGSGWYVNDYGRGSSGGDSAKAAKSEASEPASSVKSEKSDGDAKSPKPAKETKKSSAKEK